MLPTLPMVTVRRFVPTARPAELPAAAVRMIEAPVYDPKYEGDRAEAGGLDRLGTRDAELQVGGNAVVQLRIRAP